MTYLFFSRGNPDPRQVPLRDDLSARQAASLTTDIIRVETPAGRVVWRRVEDIETIMARIRA